MSKKHSIVRHYGPRIKKEVPHFEILDWADEKSQHTRFEVLADNVELDGKFLLDVGCGLCDLWKFLAMRRISPFYTGVDIVGEMVEHARSIHPDLDIQCVDLFEETLPGDWCGRKFDVVFCSGMLNLDLGNSHDFTQFAIRRMAELSRGVLVFNLLHHRTEEKHPHCVYHDPKKIINIAEKIGSLKIIENYLPNDFTVIVTIGGQSV